MQKDIERLRHEFHQGRLDLFSNVTWKSPSRNLLEEHSSLVDGLLKEIFEISCRAADLEATRSRHSGLAIVATGGYGRMELNPYSDIDIAFIPSEEEDPWVEALVHTAFKLVMDVFLSLRDVHVGYAFRPIAEASAWDVATKTALLDLRHICGDPALAKGLERRICEVLSPVDIMLESVLARESYLTQMPSTYVVEPNLKEGTGSLRDLHRARWIFKLLLRVDSHELYQELQDRAGIPARQIVQIQEAADWFWRARSWLHLAAGKLSDVLITNYQDRIAFELNDCSSQVWLSKHLAHAETLARFREMAFRALLQGPYQIGGIWLENGVLQLPVITANFTDSINLLHVAQRYGIPVGLNALNKLEEERAFAMEIKDPTSREVRTFHQILDEHQQIASTLRALSEFGILDRFIPNFSEVMRFVPPDPAHRYTVGEHSIRMIEHLENLRAGADSSSGRFTDLLGQCAHFDMLCLAALLHDAGKLIPGKDHCESSAELAKSVAVRLRVTPEKRELLDILIRQHLLLVRTARLHDLKSANIIYKVAELVPSLEALQHLYVFTYVDTIAVAENNWTSMDLRDLEDLYMKMQVFYSHNAAEVPGSGEPEDKSILVRKKIEALQVKNEIAVQKHCDSMPSSYVLNTPLEEIAFHLRLLERLETEEIALDVYNRPGDDYSELTICAYDDSKPGMLAKITGVLYGMNVDIHRAQAFTMEKERPVILDTLWVRSNQTQISENKARRIQKTFKDVLTGKQSIEHFLKQAGKNPPEGILLDAIDLRNDLSEEHTVVHIVAPDLQGLLYLMTRALSRCGLHIHSAKIATWQARAENNFYFTAIGGGQIPDSDLQAWTTRLDAELRGTESVTCDP
jgi:[protein-PII] uridylyltransferase